ncbi:MAG: coenzyme F420 biosynthesis-associated protein [Micromonosporaceae bacterium]|nr:coenzyme F420 biosynthesis-associated protein [Micromonosporaceae bacterium]
MVQLVDWDLAAATAGTFSKSGPKATYEEAAAVVSELRKLTDLAEAHVREFTGLRAQVSHPPVRIVDRADWSAANVAGLRQVFEPLMESLTAGNEPGPLTQAVGSRITGVQAGTVLGYLSGKVLGQYEVFSSDPGVLLLVAPNIVEVERKLDADPRDFRLWVCLHEVTHRTQFTAVPWLRGAFFAEVEAFVRATQLASEQLVERLRRAMDAIAGAVRDPDHSFSVLDLVQTPAQREVLDRLTAMMTLLEGHAEYVMDGVGPDVVRTVDEIRAKFNQRREAGNPFERVIRKLLGIDVKLRQYAEGRKFVHAVVDRVGMDGFNQIWSSQETLPRKSELSDPDAWIERVLGAGATETITEDAPAAAPPTTEQPAPEKPEAEQPAAQKSTAKKSTAKKTTAKKAVKKMAPPSDGAAPTKRIRPRKAPLKPAPDEPTAEH